MINVSSQRKLMECVALKQYYQLLNLLAIPEILMAKYFDATKKLISAVMFSLN